jgi:hypothetical protein
MKKFIIKNIISKKILIIRYELDKNIKYKYCAIIMLEINNKANFANNINLSRNIPVVPMKK